MALREKFRGEYYKGLLARPWVLRMSAADRTRFDFPFNDSILRGPIWSRTDEVSRWMLVVCQYELRWLYSFTATSGQPDTRPSQVMERLLTVATRLYDALNFGAHRLGAICQVSKNGFRTADQDEAAIFILVSAWDLRDNGSGGWWKCWEGCESIYIVAIEFRIKYIYSTKKISENAGNLWSYHGMPTLSIISEFTRHQIVLHRDWCRGTELCEAKIVRHKKYDRSIILGVRDRSVTNYSHL